MSTGKKVLVTFKICLVAASLFVTSALAVGVYSAYLFFDNGEGLPIEIPEPDQVTMTMKSGGVLMFTAPLTIKNNGIYPVEDLNIDLHLFYNETEIFTGKNPLGDIPAHHTVTRTIVFQTSIQHLVSLGMQKVLFEDLNTTLRLEVRARYVFSWIGFSLAFFTEKTWKPPVKVSADTGNTTFTRSNAEIIMGVPVTVETAGWLEGNATAETTIQFNGQTLGNGTYETPFGGKHTGTMNITMTENTMDVLATQSGTMDLKTDITAFIGGQRVDYSTTYQEEWHAPLRDLSTSVYKQAGDTIQVEYSFTNDRDTGDLYNITIAFFNNTTPTGYTIENQHYVSPGEYYYFSNNYPYTASQPANRYVLTVETDEMGLVYVEEGAL